MVLVKNSEGDEFYAHMVYYRVWEGCRLAKIHWTFQKDLRYFWWRSTLTTRAMRTPSTTLHWDGEQEIWRRLLQNYELRKVFFSKLITHTHLALRRRQQLARKYHIQSTVFKRSLWSHCDRNVLLSFNSYSQYLPVSFTNQHGDKLDDWVVLLTRSSSRTWRVRLCFFKKPRGAQISCGWNNFVADNHLKNGDSLIFVLNVETTFQVYIFRRSRSDRIANSRPSFVASET